ncbi:hypothetical protein ACFOHS_13120 [Jhaorihella thermophila]
MAMLVVLAARNPFFPELDDRRLDDIFSFLFSEFHDFSAFCAVKSKKITFTSDPPTYVNTTIYLCKQGRKP